MSQNYMMNTVYRVVLESPAKGDDSVAIPGNKKLFLPPSVKINFSNQALTRSMPKRKLALKIQYKSHELYSERRLLILYTVFIVLSTTTFLTV